MSFDGIIITGTSCSGKKSIMGYLSKCAQQANLRFEQVHMITTSEQSFDDNCYDHVSEEKFKNLQEKNVLLINTEYQENHYGIQKTEVDRIIKSHHIPVLVITPSLVNELLSSSVFSFMCFFIDSTDEVLLERKSDCDAIPLNKKEIKHFLQQCEIDRKYQDDAHYIFSNSDSKLSADLICLVWKYRDVGGTLSVNWIKKMIDCGVLLRNASPDMIKGASYDLRLGDEYYYNGKIQHLTPSQSFLTIEPYDYAIVSCKETAWIPRGIIARFGLSVSLFCQGIILSNGPQIDPGFRGTLFCLLFNTSNRAINLKRGSHYATIEFNKILDYAEPYKGRYQGKEEIINYIPSNAMHGAINELKKDVENLKAENRIMQNIYLGVVGLMFAIISILLVLK